MFLYCSEFYILRGDIRRRRVINLHGRSFFLRYLKFLYERSHAHYLDFSFLSINLIFFPKFSSSMIAALIGIYFASWNGTFDLHLSSLSFYEI